MMDYALKLLFVMLVAFVIGWTTVKWPTPLRVALFIACAIFGGWVSGGHLL